MINTIDIARSSRVALKYGAELRELTDDDAGLMVEARIPFAEPTTGWVDVTWLETDGVWTVDPYLGHDSLSVSQARGAAATFVRAVDLAEELNAVDGSAA
jgi:hypothetical protein